MSIYRCNKKQSNESDVESDTSIALLLVCQHSSGVSEIFLSIVLYVSALMFSLYSICCHSINNFF
jgi:hypothetical protein